MRRRDTPTGPVRAINVQGYVIAACDCRIPIVDHGPVDIQILVFIERTVVRMVTGIRRYHNLIRPAGWLIRS